jgi:hypothetical protein
LRTTVSATARAGKMVSTARPETTVNSIGNEPGQSCFREQQQDQETTATRIRIDSKTGSNGIDLA